MKLFPFLRHAIQRKELCKLFLRITASTQTSIKKLGSRSLVSVDVYRPLSSSNHAVVVEIWLLICRGRQGNPCSKSHVEQILKSRKTNLRQWSTIQFKDHGKICQSEHY